MGLHGHIQSQAFIRAITCNVIALIQSAAQTGFTSTTGTLMNKAFLIPVLVAFSALTAYTVMHYGGLIPWLLFYTRDPASWQIFADLLIALCLLLVFMKKDAQANGRPFWPWAVFSMTCGSFGPLLYFITAKKKA
jgi:hypothetical protein